MIFFQRNEKELVWHQEYIYEDGNLIGEIFTNIPDGGYNLRKLTNRIMVNIAHFETIEDAKQFVTQAGEPLMGTLIIAIMAGFSFGYCISDIIINYRSNKRIEQFVKEHHLDD